MVVLDLNDTTIINDTEMYFINLYLREFHDNLTLNIYDTVKDTHTVQEVDCVKSGKGITTVYINYDFRDNASYEIELEFEEALIYRGQIITGTDLIEVSTDNRNILKY